MAGSRLIVKNLPKYADETRVRQHFASQGEITDVKVLRTKDGRSRCFAFVGFKSDEQAGSARRYFDNSCMGTSRLSVAFAESYKATHRHMHTDSAPAWPESSRLKQGKLQAQPSLQDDTESKEGKELRNQKLLEFLGLMKPKSKQQMFANDDPVVEPSVVAASPEPASGPQDNASDEPEYDDVSDLDYLRSRMVKFDTEAEPRSTTDDMPEAAASTRPDDANNATEHTEAAPDALTMIRHTRKLFLRNLAFATTDDEVKELMEQFGAVEDARVVRDKSTGKSKGFGVAVFSAPADAVSAFEELDGQIFQGRLLHILPGKPAVQAVLSGEAQAEQAAKAKQLGGFKAQRESKRKAHAGDKSSWNTFFMREDTVAEAAAQLLGVSKAELLDPEAPDAAVRMALGETQVLAATKEELADAGVHIAALERAALASGHASSSTELSRSRTVLLVKNLPFEATEDSLHELISEYGGCMRVLLPSTKALALVEMHDEQAASRAFKSLAYKRFLHVPLYLEYAPDGVWDRPDKEKAGVAKSSQRASDKPSQPATENAAARASAEVPDGSNGALTTLYIKNVAFETSRDALQQRCSRAATAAGGFLRSLKMPTKKSSAGKELMQGYAFAEFSDQQTANAALQRLHGADVDGHKLHVQVSKKDAPAGHHSSKRSRDGSDTKVMVRNLAFEATVKDVRQLMEAFGHVKTCRLPKKFDGTSRGFAFVEFATKGEAQKAMAVAHGTHLYGRRLLLEYANGQEDVNELRSKASRLA